MKMRELATLLLVDEATEHAAGAWAAFSRGEFVEVERIEREGATFVVARRPSRRSPLLHSELVAVRMRANGTSLKVIADELEVSLSTASRLVSRAMKKLGARTHADLVRLVALRAIGGE